MLNLVVLQAGCFPRRAVQVVGSLLAGDNFQQTILKLSANSQQLSSTLSNSLEALEWNEDQNEIRTKSEPQLSSPLISFSCRFRAEIEQAADSSERVDYNSGASHYA